MVKLFQIMPGDTEYFGLLLIESSDSQNYLNGYKGVCLLQYTMKSPISGYQQY